MDMKEQIDKVKEDEEGMMQIRCERSQKAGGGGREKMPARARCVCMKSV